MMKTLSIYLLTVGCLWALVVVWLFLGLSAISEPVSITAVVFYYGGLLIGPLALVVGSVLVLRGTFARQGAVLAGVGCAILTGLVLYDVWSVLQPPKPLEFRPVLLYLMYAFLSVIFVISDFAAYKLFRLVNRSLSR